jgi:hypothetical protein
VSVQVELKGPGYTSNYNNVLIIIPAIIIVTLVGKFSSTAVGRTRAIVSSRAVPSRFHRLSTRQQLDVEETAKGREGPCETTEESRPASVASTVAGQAEEKVTRSSCFRRVLSSIRDRIFIFHKQKTNRTRALNVNVECRAQRPFTDLRPAASSATTGRRLVARRFVLVRLWAGEPFGCVSRSADVRTSTCLARSAARADAAFPCGTAAT